MKKNIAGFHTFFVIPAHVIAMTILFAAAALAAEKESVDVNGGFEEGTSDSFKKWGFLSFEKSMYTSEEKVHGGSRALRIPINADTEGKIQGVHQTLDVNLFKSGDVVGISAYVFLTNYSFKPTLAIQVFGPDSQPIAVATCKVEDIDGEWQFVEASLTVPEGFNENCTANLVAKFSTNAAPADNNDAYIDDIQVSIEPKAQ